ncbi:MAG: response regulator [Bacteroidota bacterium]|nr:response regulator [Bacteroidota bacterium]
METGKGEWILIVEDDWEISSLLEVILCGVGYKTVVANDGEEAESLYKSHQPPINLVLSDLGLPKLGGVELFEKLIIYDPKIKFIASSGFSDLTLASELKSKGVKEFIAKPYLPENLFQTIRKILDTD